MARRGTRRTEKKLQAVKLQRSAGGGINPFGKPSTPSRKTPPPLDFKTKLKHPKPTGLY